MPIHVTLKLVPHAERYSSNSTAASGQRTEHALAGKEKRPMIVHPLIRRKSDCLAAPSAVLTHEGGALSSQGASAAACISFGLIGALDEDEHQFEASFPADPAAIRAVRRRLWAQLHENGLEHVADDVALICQELMANAVLHGSPNCPPGIELKITVAWSDVRLRAAVHDLSDEKPREHGASMSRTSGRGLRIVDELSDRWGVDTAPVGNGKSIWTEIDSPRRRTS